MDQQVKLIESFEEACQVRGYDPATVIPDVSAYPEHLRPALIATAKLFIINEALNGDWKPNWQDDEEYKWYPWFDMERTDSNPAGFGLDAPFFGYTATVVGSRLVFRTRDLARYAGKQFLDLYRDMMVIS